MPDMTIEVGFICAEHEEYCTTPPSLRKMLKMRPAKCQWNSEYSDLEVTRKDGEYICPQCGGSAVAYKFAV